MGVLTGAGEASRTWSRRHGVASARTVSGAAGNATGAPQAVARSGRPASIASAVAATRSRSARVPRWSAGPSPQAMLRRPRRRTAACGTPSPLTSPTPTARRVMSMPGVPGGKAASRTAMRTVRARSGAGRAIAPSAATASGAVGRPSATTRTRVGKRTRTGARSRRSVRIVRGARVRHCSHAPRERIHPAIHGRRGSPSKADEARLRPRPSKREDPSKAVVAVPAVHASSTWSGVSGATLTHASARHARAAGGAIARAQARSPSCWSRTRPRERVPVTTRGRDGSSPVVRSKR